MSQKLSKIIGISHRLKEESPSSILKSIYNTLRLSHLNYRILSWGFQCQEIYLLQKRAIRNNEKAGYRAHTEPIFKSLNLIKVQDIYYLAILKFYSKLIKNNLLIILMISCLIFQLVPQIITLEIQICNCQELDMNLPRYQLISTLNETSPEIMEMAKKCTQYIFINHVRKNIVDGYRDACENPNNCYSCNN